MSAVHTGQETQGCVVCNKSLAQFGHPKKHMRGGKAGPRPRPQAVSCRALRIASTEHQSGAARRRHKSGWRAIGPGEKTPTV